LHALLTGSPQKQDINEVFGRNKFEKMQQQINQSYDFVIFDLPPILEAWEVPPVLQTTDVTIWVTRSDYSDMDKIEQIDLLANELQIPKLFFVLNGKKPLGLLAKLSNTFKNLANWLKLKLKK
jgi:cellulose biosynthesis protein BcsQ